MVSNNVTDTSPANGSTSHRRDRSAAAGAALRDQVPFDAHATWAPGSDRRDPVEILQAQDLDRIPHLLPIKYGRMLESPFTFYRGSAAIMAADLAQTPATGVTVVACGDAHLSNFGIFATPERRLVFDINDFDEVALAPWEWDLKRLAASAVLAARDNGFDDQTCGRLARRTARRYRETMARLAAASILDVWYYQADTDDLLKLLKEHSSKAGKAAKSSIRKARQHTSEQSVRKLTVEVEGRRRFINLPPLVQRLEDLLTEEERAQISRQTIEAHWQSYLSSLPLERRLLLRRFRMADMALRVGGVGSVGTRCTVVLLEGESERDRIILQQKEAGPSVLAPHVPPRSYDCEAARVVLGQRAMQAASDIFLGWHRSTLSGRSYYWRQLKDMKAAIDVATLDEAGLEGYLAACAICLARAHARTGDGTAIAAYLGEGSGFDQAIRRFALDYADQVEADYRKLQAAVEAGQIPARTGI